MHDTELNPGPSDNSEFPCGSCDAPVDWVDKGVTCDTCQQWFHAGCQQICTVTYDDLGNSDASWHCAACGMRNIAPSLFMSTMTDTETVNSTFGSVSSSPGAPLAISSPLPPKRKNQTSRKTSLRLLNINCRSVSNKRGRFQNLIDSTNPDIVVVTESWLSPKHADGEIGEPGRFSCDFTIHRRDRDTDTHGGGVFIAVRNDLKSTRCEDLEPDSCELMWVKVEAAGEKALYVGAFYRAPFY